MRFGVERRRTNTKSCRSSSLATCGNHQRQDHSSIGHTCDVAESFDAIPLVRLLFHSRLSVAQCLSLLSLGYPRRLVLYQGEESGSTRQGAQHYRICSLYPYVRDKLSYCAWYLSIGARSVLHVGFALLRSSRSLEQKHSIYCRHLVTPMTNSILIQLEPPLYRLQKIPNFLRNESRRTRSASDMLDTT